MDTDAAALATMYLRAWSDDDPDRLRAHLAEDVSFRGPLAEIEGADNYVESIRGLFTATEKVVRRRMWVDDDDVLTWFDLQLPDIPPAPVAQWLQAQDGKIKRVQVTFDPRAMLGGG
ncbi:MAG: nuclear transport factor 2 family protein [Solirubrobacterales bacterium]|nr:nuclear transport factor 2 family protein [Solirubrobacterales bacterium]